MPKSKKNQNKAKLNLTVRDEQRNKLEQMASIENRSISNLIEVMADERWKRLADPPGKLSEGQEQELAETILQAHKALIKADGKNILLCKPVVDSLSHGKHPTSNTERPMAERDSVSRF